MTESGSLDSSADHSGRNGDDDRGETGRDTIFALSSGHGRAAVAVIRLSGPEAGPVLGTLAGREVWPRQASLALFRDPATGDPIDSGLALWMPGPASATGEDVAELQVHGSRAVIAAMFEAMRRFGNVRPAEPGEFARRGFENGKIDLTAAEGLADLLAAETEAQRRQALLSAAGGFRRQAEAWRDRLMRMLAMCEAELDFPDEEDVPDAVGREALDDAETVRGEIAASLGEAKRGETLRDGFRVVIAGPPNAGKSTLINALSGRDVAIVSAEPGTTRDILEVRLDLDGYPVLLQDTAGLREAKGAIEAEGMRRARGRALEADLVLWLSPADEAAEAERFDRVPVLTLRSKADLAGGAASGAEETDLAISAKTGDGLDALTEALRVRVSEALDGEPALVTRERQKRALEDCADALARVVRSRHSAPLELVAEDLRLALKALGRLTGGVDVEQLLDVIFGEFCLGK